MSTWSHHLQKYIMALILNPNFKAVLNVVVICNAPFFKKKKNELQNELMQFAFSQLTLLPRLMAHSKVLFVSAKIYLCVHSIYTTYHRNKALMIMWVHFFLNFKISFQVLRTALCQIRYYKCVHSVISALANILTQRNFRCITQKMASSFSWHQRHLLKFVYYPQCNAPMHFLIKSSSIANAVQGIIKYVFLTFIFT